MDLAALAATTAVTLSPYLAEGGKEAAKTVGREAVAGATQLLGWLRDRLTGAAKDSLTKLEAEPGKARNLDRFKADLKEALEADPALRNELVALLGEPPPAGGQNMTQTGTNLTGAQADRASCVIIRK